MSLPGGSVVDNVIYRYTVTKEAVDPLLVSVENLHSSGDGYAFRSTDDWSGVAGNSIYRVIPVSIPGSAFGRGSISTSGIGTVSNARVVYTYKADSCFDPTPGCPNYVLPFTPPEPVSAWDPLKDSDVLLALDNTTSVEEDSSEDLSLEERLETLETILGGVNSTELAALALAQSQLLFAMSVLPSSYRTEIPGGTYNETIRYTSDNLPENKNGLRNGLAQQLKHQEMVQLQYQAASAEEILK